MLFAAVQRISASSTNSIKKLSKTSRNRSRVAGRDSAPTPTAETVAVCETPSIAGLAFQRLHPVVRSAVGGDLVDDIQRALAHLVEDAGNI